MLQDTVLTVTVIYTNAIQLQVGGESYSHCFICHFPGLSMQYQLLVLHMAKNDTAGFDDTNRYI